MRCIEVVSATIDGQSVQLLTVTSMMTCPESGLVALTLSELHSETASPWRLTLVEGGAVAASVLSVWALAYAFRAVRQALNSGEPER